MKAAGLDKIPARLVRDTEADLAPSITYLINKSIADGTVPSLWKVARVTPLYKSKDQLLGENYLPISVFPVPKQMSAYLDRVGFLYGHQNGFRRGHNTEQAVGQLNKWVLEAMDGGKLTGLLFVDISKAFDSIDHKWLLGKLELMGMSGRTLGWLSLILRTDGKVYI